MYEEDKRGLEQLSGLLERIQNNTYYPNFYKKAAYLFVALSTGHYFKNGNKRIALFTYVHFSRANKLQFRSIRAEQYKRWFDTHFPNYKLSKQEFHSNVGWALYHFNKAMNIKFDSNTQGHSYSFNELKQITEDFIRFVSRRK